MKFNFPLNNFSSGEWSPKMHARTETEQYPRSCETMTNMITQVQGGAALRGGLLCQGAEGYNTIIEDLAGSVEPIYGGDVMPAGHKMIPYIPADATYSRILVQRFTSVQPGVLTDGGKWLSAQVVDGYTSFNDVDVDISTITTDPIGGWNPLTSQYVQVGDLLVIADGEGKRQPVVVYADIFTTFLQVKSLEAYVMTNTSLGIQPYQVIPWGKVNALGIAPTISASATTGSVTLTASASLFRTGMVGTYVRLCNGTSAAGVARITAYTSTTAVTATVLKTLSGSAFAYGSSANTASFWQMSAWNNTAGWPKTVTAFQGRIVFGGSSQFPDTIWGSRIANYFMFEEIPSPDTTGVNGFANAAYTADNSRPFALASNSAEASIIVALSSAKTLTIHTTRSEIVAYGSNGALGPNNVVFESSTSYGGSPVQPARVNNFLTFVQGNRKKIRDIIFNFNEDQYKSTDLSFVAEHLFRGDSKSAYPFMQVLELAAVQTNNSVLFVRNQNRDIKFCTLDRDYQVNAWGTLEIGRNPSLPNARVQVLAMCSFIDYSDGEEALHVLTARRNLADTAYIVNIEVMQAPWDDQNPFATQTPTAIDRCPVYLDFSSYHSSLTATDTWDVGTQYANQPVVVVADGNEVGTFTPNGSGILTLTNEASRLVIGFPYEGILKTTPIEAGGQIGVPQGRHKKIDELVIRFFNSAGCQFGHDIDNLDEIPFRSIDQPMNEGIAFFTGEKVVDFPASYARALQVIIRQQRPYPMHITAVVPRGVTYD